MGGCIIGMEKTKGHLMNRLYTYIFILPALLIFIFVILVPVVSGVYYSFTNWSGMTRVIKWIGLDNYRRLFEDRVFYVAIKNTIFLTGWWFVFRMFLVYC
jgi:ABC-type sugar transport system permease subunit